MTLGSVVREHFSKMLRYLLKLFCFLFYFWSILWHTESELQLLWQCKWVLNSLCWSGIKLTPQQQPELLYHNGSSELFLSSAASTKIGI